MTETVPGIRLPAGLLADVAAQLADTVPGRPLVGVTAVSGDEIAAAAWSSARARMAEETQIICGDSPGFEALRTGKPVLVPDLRRPTRWHECCVQLRLLGLGSALSVPVLAGDERVAVLDLYADRPHGFDTDIDDLIVPATALLAAAALTA